MIGKTISHYKIIEEVGRGGMGIVYKARDLKLDRFIALKFLPAHLTTSEEEKQRFIHEAKAASTLEHNNICNVHEIDETKPAPGEAGGGQLFISMAYYEGEPLDKKVKEKPLPIEEAIDIASQIAQGLAKAHENKIVHRDLKPSNIMLTTDGVIKILDFGLAKLPTQTKLTKEGTTLGTVSYMSPEQTRGDMVDGRSDIWSLGVILYEMIAGQLPFKGDYDQAVMYAISNEIPEPISGLRTGVPLELERIINRCLSNDPQERYQHADDLLSELNKLKKETELEKSTLKRKTPKKKRPSLIIPPIFIAILVVIITGYLLLNPFQIDTKELTASEWENSIAVLPFADLSPDKDQEYFCDGITDKILTGLSKLRVLKVIARTSVMQYKNTEKTIPEIGNELGVENILEGSIFKAGNRIRVTAKLINASSGAHVWADDYERKLDDIFDIQDDISEKITMNLLANISPQEINIVRTERPANTDAYEYFLKGEYFHKRYWSDHLHNAADFKRAEKMYLKAIKFDSSYTSAYTGLANLYHTHHQFFPDTSIAREKYLNLHEKLIKKAYDIDSTSSYVCFTMALFHKEQGNRAKTYQYFKKSISKNNNDPYVQHNLGLFLRNLGLLHLALKHMERAVVLNPLVPYFYAARGNIYKGMGNFKQAKSDFIKSLELNPDHKGCLMGYTVCLIDGMDFEQAEQNMNKVIHLYPDDQWADYMRSLQYVLNGERDKSLQIKTGNPLNIYLILRMKDQAILFLFKKLEQQKANEQSRYLMLMNQERFDILRSDPRFQEILTKHKEIYEENLRKYGDIDL